MWGPGWKFAVSSTEVLGLHYLRYPFASRYFRQYFEPPADTQFPLDNFFGDAVFLPAEWWTLPFYNTDH